MTRKIVQIAAAQCWDNHVEDLDLSLYALCDDGSLWVYLWARDPEDHPDRWRQLNEIPQVGDG
jgi:hypothetical protein